MTDSRKTTGIRALTRPDAEVRDGPHATGEDWDERALPAGSRIGEFEVTGLIGKGGFGIVYLAWDHSLERAVALKEYMPASFAVRTNHTDVRPQSERHRETFQVGLNSFVNEAKLLARFHNPSLVEVYRFWESNGTAYMAMPFYKGTTLGETIRSMSTPPGETWLKDLLTPLTDALLELHAAQCYHRDIAPDNILILEDSGAPLLLDFGAARRVIAGQAHALTVILKGGYAPIEQYGEFPDMQQGPWTDVYALASVVYWAVTGETPPAATGRMIRDTCVPLAERAPPGYSRNFASAIDRALAVMPNARTASIDILRRELGLAAHTENRAASKWADDDATILVPPAGPRSVPLPTGQADPPVGLADSAAAPAREAAARAALPATADLAPTELATVKPASAHRAIKTWPAAGIGVAATLALAGTGAWLFFTGRPATHSAPAKVVQGDSTSQLRSQPPVASAPATASPEPPPAAATPVPVPVPVPTSAADALDLILARKSDALRVDIDLARSQLKTDSAKRSLGFTASQPGHVYLIGVHGGKDEGLELIVPRPQSAPARTGTRGKIVLPALEPGAWSFALILTRQAIDLEAHGWIVEGKTWRRRFASSIPADASRTLPWEIPACAPAEPSCESPYGAASFYLEIAAAGLAPSAKRPALRPEATERKADGVNREATKKAANPECEKILMRLSLGETDQALIDRMKSLKCN